MSRLWALRVLSVVGCVFGATQALAQETDLGAAFRREREEIAEDCSGFDPEALISCGNILLTGSPLHIAVGSMAPENGFGVGLAFVWRRAPSENWRLNFSTDAVRAFGGAWRAGGYLKIVRTSVDMPVVDPGGASAPSGEGIRPYGVGNVYAQTITLPTLSFFGLGPESTEDSRAIFGMRETIVGINAILPVRWRGGERVNLSLFGEINGRFVDIRSAPADEGPSIEQIYSEDSAPGLERQPGVAQFAQGVRVEPSLVNDRLRLNYLGKLEQFAASDSRYSFRRWTADLGHDVPIYRRSALGDARAANTPNECAVGPTTPECPPVSWSRNRTGTIGFRFLMSKADSSPRSVVPFYFQQTLGGSNINGERILASYADYRFRGRHLMVLRQSLEHSLFGPVGLWLAADQGRVGPDDGRDFGKWRQSYTAGVTIRAGGIPFVMLTWATGGSEGSHVALTMSPTLLGGSSRPSLH